jgi:hypothetical protein
MPPIPPVFGWAAGLVAAVALTRVLIKEWRRVNEVLHPRKVATNDGVRRDAIPTLRRDPRTGIYRPD